MLETWVGAIGDDLVALHLGELFVGRIHHRPTGVMNTPRKLFGLGMVVPEELDQQLDDVRETCALRR